MSKLFPDENDCPTCGRKLFPSHSCECGYNKHREQTDMQSYDTQPLTPNQMPPQSFTNGIISEEKYQKAWETWKQALQDYQKEPEHVHGPFTFLLNQNHNALRGCQSCGATWVGVMAGLEDDIRWHEVQEPPEEEE